MLQAYQIKSELLQGKRFQTQLHDDALSLMVLELLEQCPSYWRLASNVTYEYTVAMEDNHSTNPLQYQPWWYEDSLRRFLLPALTGLKQRHEQIPVHLQLACYYLLFTKFNCNLNDRNKGVLHDREAVHAFMDAANQVFALLDNGVLTRQMLTPNFKADRGLRMFFLRGKAIALRQQLQLTNGGGGRFAALMRGEDGSLDSAAVLSSTGKETLRITVMNEQGGTLTIEAVSGLVDFLQPGQFRLFALAADPDTGEEERYDAVPSQIYPLIKCFGITYRRKYPVQFCIPSTRTKRLDITFYYEFQGSRYPMNLAFGGGSARLYGGSRNSFWMFRPRWMLRLHKGKGQVLTHLEIRKVRRRTRTRRELAYDGEILRSAGSKAGALQIILVRWLYWLLLPSFRKKHLWVAFDKLYKAGDNGEYMYQYLRKNCPDVEPYYIIRRESPDFERLIREDKKHILVYGTLKCLLYCLLAEVFLDTHANIPAQYTLDTRQRVFTRDLQRGRVVCIQHGLTIQKIAQFQNRLFDNIELYCCASPYEVENISHPIYGYTPEQLKLTGLARYDGLVNRDQKIILITPSWRKNVVNSSVANQKKTHNNNFKNSDYYRIYNRLINDKDLIACAKRTGYRIVYLLHPAMSAQLEDFDRNDYVELVPATGDVSYEKILCESSLMVTDYSGVQFDFAYMRKPIVYYHPDDLPPHYEEGGLVYATQGFGPICTRHDQLISQLCQAMERGCTIEAEYIRRADDFFAFDDHNNCQRIYQEVIRWLEEQK